MVERFKYNIGDEVTVRGKVIQPSPDRPLVRFDQPERVCSWQFHADDSTIDKHTPAPRELKPGDKVRVIDSGAFSSASWTVIAADGDLAWLKGPDGMRGVWNVTRFRHVDEAGQ